MENHIEIWKPIKGFESSHMVSNIGRVKSIDRTTLRTNGKSLPLKGRFISSWVSSGYEQVTLNNKHKFLVHRLVAIAFLENPLDLSQVNHLDGDKLNNNVWNLEWCTPTENIAHSLKLGTFYTGSKCASAKLKETDIPTIFKMRIQGLSAKQIGDKFGVGFHSISQILNRKTWKHVAITLSLLLCTFQNMSAQIGKPNQDTSKCFGYTELRYIASSLVEGRTCDTLLGIAKTKLVNRDSTIKELNTQKSKLQVQSDLKDALLKMKDDDNKILAKNLKTAELNLKWTKFGWAATAILLSATATYFVIR